MSAFALFFELVVRTALIAAGTAAVLWVLRIRAASVRHAAWAAVVVAMLVLPLLLVAKVRMSLPVLAPAPTQVETRAGKAVTTSSHEAATRTIPDEARWADFQESPTWKWSRPVDWRSGLLGLYGAGALLLLLRLVIGTVHANRLRRDAVIHDGRLTSDRCITPITVGWIAPVLVLPRGWDHWSNEQLTVVLTHEREHARRRDPLTQWLALFNRAVFWFHPLAWWLERRLAALAEEACDAAVLAAGHSPHDYAQYLLDMAHLVSRQRGRVRLVGMAMPGAGLSGRLRLILRGLPRAGVSRARLLCTIGFCTISSVVFAAGTLAERAAQQRSESPAQSPAAMEIKFEAVSIRPCLDTGEPGGRGGGTSMRNAITPGYASWGCVTLSQLIDQAYGGGPFPNNSLQNTIRMPPGQRLDTPKRIRGGPSWVENERFAIEIRLSGDVTTLAGSRHHDAVLTAMAPALRSMIEDRFQLRLRKATEEQRMYALTAPAFNLTVSAPDKCWKPEDYPRPPGLSRMELPPPPPGWEGIPPCGYQANGRRVRGNESIQFTHISLGDLAKWLSREMDRYVLDKTNRPGRFSFRLEFAPDDNTPGITQSNQMFTRAGAERWRRTPPDSADGDGPTIFKALEMLGLKLEQTKGPAEYLLIKSVQRPKPNLP
jgi:uncharacterized protein (TIGR03435 family)